MINASAMSSKIIPQSQGATSTKNSISENNNLTLASTASMATTDSADGETNPTTASAASFAATMAHDTTDANIAISTLPPTAPATLAGREKARATRNTLYNVICCRCKKILNLQNVHYAFYCVSCHHRRCNNCTMQAI